MAKYDNMAWHYGGDYPKNLPNENAATHIGMFLQWCIENDLLSEWQQEDCEEDIQKIKEHKMTGGEFLIKNCDEKFVDDDLCELGNNFAEDYYNNDTKFGKKYGSYIDDYSKIFDEYETLYHVKNTFENYNLLKPIIDKRFEEWKKYKKIV
jgi:hypothetical protein